jgi:hypothetical protein
MQQVADWLEKLGLGQYASDLPNQVAELGGMCFSPLHANVCGLCDELNLASSRNRVGNF